MTTDAGSFKSYQLSEGRTTPVSVRVSPTEKIRAEIDALFGGERELGEVIEDVARLGARLIIQTALEAEVEAFLGRARYQRSAAAVDARPGSRNGYSPATVKTTAGPVTIARPKLRGTAEAFASRLFGTTVTKSNALESLVIAGFVRGLSARDVENTLADALGAEAALSKSTASRVCQAIGGQFETWRTRPDHKRAAPHRWPRTRSLAGLLNPARAKRPQGGGRDGHRLTHSRTALTTRCPRTWFTIAPPYQGRGCATEAARPLVGTCSPGASTGSQPAAMCGMPADQIRRSLHAQ
jgi:hypothetical protein